MTRRPAQALRIYLEEGKRRTFAMALDWPGWGRAGRDAEGAIEALVAYRDRYAIVARAAGETVPAQPAVDVVARVPGNATTDFGAPGVVPPSDGEGWTPSEAHRQTGLLRAAWQRFDDVV